MNTAVKSILLAFYQGGTKLKAGTTHTPEELKKRIDDARKVVGGTDCEIDTVNEDASVQSDKLYLTRNGLLFYSIQVPKQDPQIVVAALYEGGGHGSLTAQLVRDVLKAYFDTQARLKQQTSNQTANIPMAYFKP